MGGVLHRWPAWARGAVTAFTIGIAMGWALAARPVVAQPDTTAFESALEGGETTPWTHLRFANDPEAFQFAIVGDRTGGRRPGVFQDAVAKLNRLRPEFVMSVGDLIEGYTDDSLAVAVQWRAFDGVVGPLEVPFFALPGNHDISNDMMRRQWRARYGAAFYTFTYKGALFIVMDSNDGDGVEIGERQVGHIRKVLRRHADARWTFVFMHHPLWRAPESGWDRVEAALAGRPHTVLAGHTHRYEQERRAGGQYMILGTTGGGSPLRGPRFGEFDHITWVTVTTDRGPVFLNLALDGLWEADVSTPKTVSRVEHLEASADLAPQVLLSPDRRSARVQLQLANGADRPVRLRGAFFHHHTADLSIRRLDATVAPNAERFIRFDVKTNTPLRAAPAGPPSRSEDASGGAAPPQIADPTGMLPGPLELQWTLEMDYGEAARAVALQGRYGIPLAAASGIEIGPDHDEFLDTVRVRLRTPYPETTLRYTTDGRAPTATATPYDGPITLTETTRVRVRAFSPARHRSEVVAKTFERVAPRPASEVPAVRPGLAYAYYLGQWRQLPAFDKLPRDRTGVARDFDVEALADRDDHFAIAYAGFIDVPTTGRYRFSTRSDDGTKFYLGDELVVDNDGTHGAQTASGYVALAAGRHPIRLHYFENAIEQTLELYVTPPGEPRQPVPFDWLIHAPE